MQIIDKAVGIDLGTTNSAVGIMNMEDSEVILYRDDSQRETTPSCVWRNPRDGKIVVGHQAFARCGSIPSPARSFKRYMGSQTGVELGDGHKMSPVELSSEVLKEMKRQIDVVAAKQGDVASKWVVTRAI